MTADFDKFERYGVIMQPDDKDAALLPRKINGEYALLHRPANHSAANIWIGVNSDTINLYYGAADTCIALAKGSISELLEWLDRHGSPEKP